MKKKKYEIYVDGSFINGNCSYGAIILEDGKQIESLSGKITEKAKIDIRQVAGELDAVIKSLEWCIKNKISDVIIYYDYKGIECWATGEWQAKNPITKDYVKFIKNCNISIIFKKVTAHTGDFWNEKVDKLAKEAADGESVSNSINENLQKVALDFSNLLKINSIKAQYDNLYNDMYARIEIIDNYGKRSGIIDIYKTKKKNYTIDLRGFKDKDMEYIVKDLYSTNKDSLLSKF